MNNSLIQTIKSNIQAWDEVRNTNLALPFLTSGYGICLKYQDYQNWKANSPQSIHCYLGINELELEFYMVDNVTDNQESYQVGNNLLIKPFIRRINPNSLPPGSTGFSPIHFVNNGISSQEAETRVMQWILSSQSWFQDQRNKLNSSNPGLGIVQVFTIPFSDLEELFDNNSNSNNQLDVYAMMALKDYGGNHDYNLELILAHVEQFNNPTPSNVKVFQDVTQPHPPFSLAGSGFKLLS